MCAFPLPCSRLYKSDLFSAYAPLLLERKAQKMRKSDAESGHTREITTIFQVGDKQSWGGVFSKALIRPFKIFACEPVIQLLGFYMAFIYGVWYLFLTTMPSIFQGVYGERPGIAGLHYLALGGGVVLATQISGKFVDRIYKHLVNTRGIDGKGRPEFRLRKPCFFA